jgi:hypothetical protein
MFHGFLILLVGLDRMHVSLAFIQACLQSIRDRQFASDKVCPARRAAATQHNSVRPTANCAKLAGSATQSYGV